MQYSNRVNAFLSPSPAVYHHQLYTLPSCMYTVTSCIQSPAVYHHQLYTVPSCIPSPAVYRPQLYTVPSCIPFPALYRPQLYTVPSSIPSPALYRPQLYTVPSCIPFPALYCPQLYTVPSSILSPALYRSQLYTVPSCIPSQAIMGVRAGEGAVGGFGHRSIVEGAKGGGGSMVWVWEGGRGRAWHQRSTAHDVWRVTEAARHAVQCTHYTLHRMSVRRRPSRADRIGTIVPMLVLFVLKFRHLVRFILLLVLFEGV